MPRLTKKRVEAATVEAGKRSSWIGDSEVPGFGVWVYPSGRRVYSLRYRTRSRRQRMMKLGEHGELTVDQARALAMRYKLAVLEGGDPVDDQRRAAAGIVTVRDLMLRWIEEHAKAHRRSWEEDRRRVQARILPTLGKLRVADLTAHRLASWHRAIGTDEGSPVEANRSLETLRAAWRWGSRHEILPADTADPTARVTRYRERSRSRWLDRAELERLMQATRSEADPYVRAAVPLLLLTGLRKGELLSARWEHINWDRGEILLPSTKAGEAQTRLLPPEALKILRDLPRERSPWVFPSPVQSGAHRKDFKRQWERIRESAGLPDVTLHDLRRTAGSYMAQAGVPLQVIQKVLGHSHPAVTKLYARLASDTERGALETLSGELREILEEGGV